MAQAVAAKVLEDAGPEGPMQVVNDGKYRIPASIKTKEEFWAYVNAHPEARLK